MTTESTPDKEQDDPAAPLRGVVFAAVRPRHRTMARRAARAFRAVCPDLPIDLFTDEPLEDPVFDQIHLVDRTWHRPKIEALRRSRFERTLYLDNDVIAVADGSDILDLLDKADIAGVHDNSRNSNNAKRTAGVPLPPAFPSINGGVLAVRRSPLTQDFLRAWEARMDALNHHVDQPSLRSLLWDRNIALAIAPIEYNLMHHRSIWSLTRFQTAPRFLHVRELNRNKRDLGDPTTPFRPDEVFSAVFCALLRRALRTDETLPRPSPLAATEDGPIARRLLGLYYSAPSRILFNRRYLREIRRLKRAAAREAR